jgi:hypothetical protein
MTLHIELRPSATRVLMAVCALLTPAAAAELTTYTGRYFSFVFPSAWRQLGPDEESRITVAPAAAIKLGGIRWGAVLGFAVFEGAAGQEQTRLVLNRLMRGNPESVRESETSIRTGAGEGTIVRLHNRLPDGAHETIRIALFCKTGGVLYVILVTPANEDKSSYRVLRDILESARFVP